MARVAADFHLSLFFSRRERDQTSRSATSTRLSAPRRNSLRSGGALPTGTSTSPSRRTSHRGHRPGASPRRDGDGTARVHRRVRQHALSRPPPRRSLSRTCAASSLPRSLGLRPPRSALRLRGVRRLSTTSLLAITSLWRRRPHLSAPYYPAFDNDLRVRNGTVAVPVHGDAADTLPSPTTPTTAAFAASAERGARPSRPPHQPE